MAKFSVIIPTYNRLEILTKTLRCLEQQETGIEYEVIVVDDCSISPLSGLGIGEGRRASWRLLRSQKNLGRAATRNRGIREAKGEYILMIDDDIWATSNLLQAHYDAQKRIGGGVVIGAVPPAPDIEDTVWHRYLSRRYERIKNRLERDMLNYGLFFTGNVSIPRRLLEEVGTFEEAFKGYSFEDTEIGYRLYKAEVPFIHARDAVGYHVFEEDLGSICDKAFQAGCSAHIFVKLHPEEARSIHYHSMIFRTWEGVNIGKNVLKFFLFSTISIKTMILITKIGEISKRDSIVFRVLPWLELAGMARGAKATRLEERVFRRSSSEH